MPRTWKPRRQYRLIEVNGGIFRYCVESRDVRWYGFWRSRWRHLGDAQLAGDAERLIEMDQDERARLQRLTKRVIKIYN